MAKYSCELKRWIDEEYLFGKSTNRILAEKYQAKKLMPAIAKPGKELSIVIECFIRYYSNDRIKDKLRGLSWKQHRKHMQTAWKYNM